MSQLGETFFTVVGCMDGRIQEVLAEYGKQKFGTSFPDTITEAGLVAQLTREDLDQAFLDSLRFKILEVSLGKHQSKGIVVNGHAECAGNPVEDDMQKKDIRKSVDIIKEMSEGAVPVVGVFVKRSTSNPSQWVVEEV